MAVFKADSTPPSTGIRSKNVCSASSLDAFFFFHISSSLYSLINDCVRFYSQIFTEPDVFKAEYEYVNQSG